LATELDMLIDRLEQMTNEINELKRSLIVPLSKGTPLAPLALPVRRLAEVTDPVITQTQYNAARAVVQAVEDAPANFRRNNPVATITKAKRKRSRAQRANDKLQSEAFRQANKALRTAKGVLRKGKTQSDVARRAQRLLRKMKKK
jgi:hypothetical protein